MTVQFLYRLLSQQVGLSKYKIYFSMTHHSCGYRFDIAILGSYLPIFTFEAVSNTVFVVVGEQVIGAEDKDFELFELSALALSLLLVDIGKGVLVDVDEFAKSVVVVVAAVAEIDEG